jgi:uncharacterized protein (TIGR00369 family)
MTLPADASKKTDLAPLAAASSESERLWTGRHVPLLETLAIVEEPAPSRTSRFRLTIDRRHLRTLGLLHGGVTATLLDTAMGRAAGSCAPAGHHVVTVQMGVNFVRPAWEGETLIAGGTVQHAGSKTAVVFGEVRTTDGLLVAVGSGTFMFLPHPDATTAVARQPDAAVQAARPPADPHPSTPPF